MKFEKTILENGMRVITVPMKDNPAVTVLVMVEAGSKYEDKSVNGISHFLEHMCFKGTIKRPSSGDISRELDSIGSQYNAFTSQEYTGYYAKSHPKYLPKILDVISDVYLNSVFDEKEIEKEKGVIIEEINMYEDLPQKHVNDVFMELLYGDQPAGWNIAGTREIVRNIKRQDFIDYRNKHYVASATTVIVAGSFDEEKIFSQIESAFQNINTGEKKGKLKVTETQDEPKLSLKSKETDQTHIILGVRAFNLFDKRVPVLKVLNSVLGGGMSSRLFQKLRHEMGVGYYVFSSLNDYTDHGFLDVSVGVDNKRVSEVVIAIMGELNKLKTKKVSEEELQKAKDYFIGNMYLELETSDSLAGFYGSQDILKHEILLPDQIAEEIKAVTSEDLMRVAKEIFQDKNLNMAMIGRDGEKMEVQKTLKF